MWARRGNSRDTTADKKEHEHHHQAAEKLDLRYNDRPTSDAAVNN